MNLLGQNVTTVRIAEKGLESFDLRYSITSNYSASGCLYGVCVEKIVTDERCAQTECEAAPCLAYSADNVAELIGLLAANTVTPCVLLETLDELVSTPAADRFFSLSSEPECNQDDQYLKQADVAEQRVHLFYKAGETCVC